MLRSVLIKGPVRYALHYKPSTPGTIAQGYHNDPIDVRLDIETFKIEPNALGKVDERRADIVAKVGFIPDGQWNADIIAALFPYFNYPIGQSIFGDPTTPASTLDTDKFLELHGTDGKKHTIPNVAVTKCPDVIFSSIKSLIGRVELTGIRKNDTPWTTDGGIIVVDESGGTFAQASPAFAPTLIKTQPYTLAWGSVAGFTSLDCEDGFTFSTDINVNMFKVDKFGTIDGWLVSVECMVKCKPIQPTMQQILDQLFIQNTGAQRGSSLAANADVLTITGADSVVYLTIPKAALKTAGYRFGSTELRDGEIGFVATRAYDGSGVQQPLATLAAS